MAAPRGKPRLLPKLQPEAYLTLQPPPPRARHPAFLYLQGLSSPSSRRALARALERIAGLIGLPVDLLKWWGLPVNHVWSIREELGKRYAPATANQALSALRGVQRIAHEQGLMGTGLYQAVASVPLLRTAPGRLARTPSKQQIARLIRAARRDQGPKGLRDAAMLVLLSGAGLKRSEVVALRLKDFEPKTGNLKVGARTIRLGGEERACLRTWIDHRGRARGPLFLPMNKAGRLTWRQMSGQAVAAVVRERAAEAGLGQLSPEDLRRAHLASLR